jgi:hypothetical protein
VEEREFKEEIKIEKKSSYLPKFLFNAARSELSSITDNQAATEKANIEVKKL